MKKALVLQEKGGVGKSYFCKLLYLYFLKKNEPITIYDCDNASLSISKFASNTIKKLGDNITNVTAENLDFLNENQKIDRSKFDEFLQLLDTNQTNCIVDFGAATSEQFLYYARENKGICEILQQLGINIYVIVAGDTSWQDCYSFIKKIDLAGLMPIVQIVANEFQGGVGDKSLHSLLKDHRFKSIVVSRISDQGDSASQEWQDFMIHGITWDEIDALPLMRRRRVNNYLDTIFEQL